MQSAERVLGIILEKSKQCPEHVFHRVYRNLFNRDLFLRAYLKLAPNEGNMTKGTDGSTIDGFGTELVDSIIDELRNETYYPKPVRREYIPKADGRLRPLGIPSFKDKLVQEALREILEAIYEPIFLDCSHGFRPGRSCHTALHRIQGSGNNSSWAIEGDISGFFDNINHDIMLKLLEKKVNDGRVIELVRRFLKAGYMEDCSFNITELGSPQGGVLSPLLANIYLHELDVFVDSLGAEYNKGKHRGINPQYRRYQDKKYGAQKKGDWKTVKEMDRLMRSVHCVDFGDPSYTRIHYNRYADDWVIFMIGDKKMAEEIKHRIAVFLKEELALDLSEKKTLITNLADRGVRFLGYEISRIKDDTKRYRNGNLTLSMPKDVVVKKLKPFLKDGKAAPLDVLMHKDVRDIVAIYGSQNQGLYEYYKLAYNVSSRMNTFAYYHQQSMLRTIAKKLNSSVNKVKAKYGTEVPCLTGHGTKIAIIIDGKVGGKAWYPFESYAQQTYVDKVPEYSITEHSKELKDRVLNGRCEVCSSTEHIEVHHVRNLSMTIKSYMNRKRPIPDWVKLMMDMKRRTLVLCRKCHNNLHNGKLKIPMNVLRRARCIERCTSGSGGACANARATPPT